MDRESIHQQLKIEQDLLRHIADALRAALDWSAADAGTARKLSTVRFLLETLQRHSHRLWAIHEYDGYMTFVVAHAPETTHAVEELKKGHESIRKRIGQVCSRFEHISDKDHATIAELIASVREILTEYEAHNERELKVIQDTFNRDTGGEG